MKVVMFRIFILLLALPAVGFSGSYPCTGKIDNFFITRTGNVELYSTEMYGNSIGRNICNTSANWKGVTVDTCKVWASTILAQIAQKKPTKIYYLTDDAASCAATLTYDSSPCPLGR